MSSDPYTNRPRPRAGYSQQGAIVQTTPYAATGSAWRNLTAKEQEARRQVKLASYGYSGFSTNDIAGANTLMSGATQFFSPQLSTDFLELPQSLRERREIYRHFYNADPIVGQAIDLHTELPLSKVRLAAPKPTTCPKGFSSPDAYGKYIHSFFVQMCDRIKLFQQLILGVHHYWLDGNVFFFAEDSEVDVPEHVGYEKSIQSILREDGTAVEEEQLVERTDKEAAELASLSCLSIK
jgi:hypothetical protein